MPSWSPEQYRPDESKAMRVMITYIEDDVAKTFMIFHASNLADAVTRFENANGQSAIAATIVNGD